MAAFQYTNFAESTLASGISAVATSATLASTEGGLFPSSGDFQLVIVRNSDGAQEIVTATARSSDVLTITREREGTSGLVFVTGDKVELRITAAVLDSYIGTTTNNTWTGSNTFSSIVTFSGTLAGGTPLIFEGATADAFETSLVITDPTADRTLTMPDADVDLGALAVNDNPETNGLRLTFESGVPVSTSDQTAKTTVYATPYKGNKIALYSGSVWDEITTAQISVAVPSTTVTPFDIFCYDNSGTATLEALDWTNDTTRATALVYQDGALVKSGATTRRYLGTARTTSVSGQSEDSLSNRFLYNYYNRIWKAGYGTFTATRNATTTSFAEFNTETRVNFILGVVEDVIRAAQNGTFSSTSAAGAVGIAFDSTTVPKLSTVFYASVSTGNVPTGLSGPVSDLAVGFHYATMLGHNGASGTTSMYSSTGAATSKANLQLELKM